MNKAATIERYAEGIKRLKARGITTFGSFILGFPGETDATVAETIDFIRATKPDFYRAQMWYNEPGTPIHLEKDKYQIKGEGFVWEHATMTSLEAMEHTVYMVHRNHDEPGSNGPYRPYVPHRQGIHMATAMVLRFLVHSLRFGQGNSNQRIQEIRFPCQ